VRSESVFSKIARSFFLTIVLRVFYELNFAAKLSDAVNQLRCHHEHIRRRCAKDLNVCARIRTNEVFEQFVLNKF